MSGQSRHGLERSRNAKADSGGRIRRADGSLQQHASGSWGDRTGWLDPNAPTWHGVTVSGFTYDSATGNVIAVGTVSQILLRANGLIGPLPDSIGDLRNLQILDLSYRTA